MRVAAALFLILLFPLLGVSQTALNSHACAACHPKEYNSQIHTSMARARFFDHDIRVAKNPAEYPE